MKFEKRTKLSSDIPTASMPDIIFMLLIFFMVTTVLRETTINVQQRLPKATELRKLQRKSLVSYLYMGKPRNISMFGDAPKLQANDVFIEVDDVIRWVESEKTKLDEAEKDQITIALKVDEEVKMGIISDVQMELRKANARKLMYSVPQRVDE